MIFKHFSFQIGVRVALLTLALVGWTVLFVMPGYPALRLLLTLVICYQVFDVFRFVSRTNAELTRFLEAVRYADFGQRFDMRRKGAGFEELGKSLTEIVGHFQLERSHQEERSEERRVGKEWRSRWSPDH